ncbi:MAG TPA: dethiobiotin synthase [Kofleriaceae bacterium]|nr:dethiobiotin synthase [Kofleriaceae bacterium]
MTGYFVTGTDTNVGKTHVTCLLARRATALGHKVFAFKPVETGCTTTPSGDRLGADQELLATAAGDWQRGPLRGVYRFALPAAPLVAATAEQTAIDLAAISAVADQGRAQASLTLVEGAGGWRVPITAAADMSALARALALPVLVIARAGLGTINHTLLTLEAVHRDGMDVAGVVLSQLAGDDPEFADSNRREIARRWPGRIVVLRDDPARLNELIPEVAALMPVAGV